MSNEQLCGCGNEACRGVNDNEHHQCGGPREACGIAGCPECGSGRARVTLTSDELYVLVEAIDHVGRQWFCAKDRALLEDLRRRLIDARGRLP